MKNRKSTIILVLGIVTFLLIAGAITFLEIDRRDFKTVAEKPPVQKQPNFSDTTPKESIDSRAKDSESSTDIKAIHGQIEGYYAQNGFYPGLAEMNSLPFIQANLLGLSVEALKTPTGTNTTFVDDPTSLNYAYKASGCNKAGIECTAYTLSALLNTGEKFTKEALN